MTLPTLLFEDVLGTKSQAFWQREAFSGFVSTSGNTFNVGIGTTSPGAKLDVNGTEKVVGAFGCNNATPQTSYASGGAITPGAGAYGADSAVNFAAMVTLVQNMRAALVANGIMS